VNKFPHENDQGSLGSIRYRFINIRLMILPDVPKIRVEHLRCSRYAILLHCSVTFADEIDETHELLCHDHPKSNNSNAI